jgi:hypothetical protein
MDQLSPDERRTVERAILELNARAWGLAFGITCAVILFVATIVLVIKGGERVGPHLGLLGIFLPGYSVSVAGAFVGFIYAFVIGYGLGRLVGGVYNRFARPS